MRRRCDPLPPPRAKSHQPERHLRDGTWLRHSARQARECVVGEQNAVEGEVLTVHVRFAGGGFRDRRTLARQVGETVAEVGDSDAASTPGASNTVWVKVRVSSTDTWMPGIVARPFSSARLYAVT